MADQLSYVRHQGQVAKTPQAILYRVNGREVWIPRSVLRDASDDILAVPDWFARKHRWQSWGNV